MKYRLLAVLVGALCSTSCWSADGYDYGPPPGGGRGRRERCEQFTTCATCTPVIGCGWCQVGAEGLCTSSPDRCAGAETFSWTWDLAYCPAEPDGGAADSAQPDRWTGTPVGDAASETATGPTDAAGTETSGDAAGTEASADGAHG
jgi:hypothetical protein